eukprot:39070_1
MTEVASFAEKSLAGSVSGAAIFIVVNPLDVLKTRLQSDPGFMNSVDSRDVKMGSVGRSSIFGSTNEIAVPGRESGLPHNYHDKRVMGISSEKVKGGRWCNLKGFRVLFPIPSWGGVRRKRGLFLSSAKATEAATSNRLLNWRSSSWFKSETVEGILHIHNQAGLRGLYRGVGMSLATGVPQTMLYFNLFDYSRDFLLLKSGLSSVTIAMLSGSFARMSTSLATAPLELLRTRILATTAETKAWSSSLTQLSMEVRRDGPGRLWNGIGVTLWRDILFSTIYFAAYETISSKLRLIMHSSSINDHQGLYAGKFVQAFTAGACAGSIAALITHPFDVMKTRIQVSETKGHTNLSKALLTMLQGESWKSIFAGLEPRLVRIAPACAIGFGVFEWGTHFLVKRRKLADCEDCSSLCEGVWSV